MTNDERQQLVAQHRKSDDAAKDYLTARGVPAKDVEGIAIGFSRVSARRYLLGSWSTFDLPAGFVVVEKWDHVEGLWDVYKTTHFTLIEEAK